MEDTISLIMVCIWCGACILFSLSMTANNRKQWEEFNKHRRSKK